MDDKKPEETPAENVVPADLAKLHLMGLELIGMLRETGGESLEYKLEGVHQHGEPIGDYTIVVSKISNETP